MKYLTNVAILRRFFLCPQKQHTGLWLKMFLGVSDKSYTISKVVVIFCCYSMTCIPPLCGKVMKIDTLKKKDWEALSSCGFCAVRLSYHRKKNFYFWTKVLVCKKFISLKECSVLLNILSHGIFFYRNSLYEWMILKQANSV